MDLELDGLFPQGLMAVAGESRDDLLELLKLRVSRLMLEEMAANDYGEEVADHLAGIERQLSGEAPFGHLDWCPREVLELERWAEPEDDRGHLKRMLACTILLRNAACWSPQSAFDEYFVEESAATVIQLTRSVLETGEVFCNAAIRFLSWLYGAQPDPALRPFAARGMVLLAATMKWRGLPDSEIENLGRWLGSVESRCRDEPKNANALWRWRESAVIARERAEQVSRAAVELVDSIVQRLG